MANELALIQPESLKTITSDAPAVFEANRTSCTRCEQAGKDLLAELNANGMSDDLDARIARYIDKTKATVKKMNASRAPLTKIFDEVRKIFTTYENTIDPTKSGTVPNQLQRARDHYAAQKLAAEEERRRKEQLARQLEEARKKLRLDMEEDFKSQFQRLLNDTINHMSKIDGEVTLVNYDQSYDIIKNIPTTFPDVWMENLRTFVRIPMGLNNAEVMQIEQDAKKAVEKQFAEQYAYEITSTKDYILDRLPSKKANLERIAKASAEEAQRMKAEMEARAREEAARQEAERRAREEEERKAADLARQQQEMESLFASEAGVCVPVAAKVSKKINLLNAEGIVPIMNTWFLREGQNLSVEELTKMFKKQITYCEKLAKEGFFIQDESIEYVDEVKAK